MSLLQTQLFVLLLGSFLCQLGQSLFDATSQLGFQFADNHIGFAILDGLLQLLQCIGGSLVHVEPRLQSYTVAHELLPDKVRILFYTQ